jgi:hypothetical protein
VALTALSCVQRNEIEAKIWKGSSVDAGVIRELRCQPDQIERGECKEGDIVAEEFLPASHPSFDMFRCMVKADLDEVIKEALRRCK